MGVSLNGGTPKSFILIGFSIIFTIHFGVPLFLDPPTYNKIMKEASFRKMSSASSATSCHTRKMSMPWSEKHWTALSNCSTKAAGGDRRFLQSGFHKYCTINIVLYHQISKLNCMPKQKTTDFFVGFWHVPCHRDHGLCAQSDERNPSQTMRLKLFSQMCKLTFKSDKRRFGDMQKLQSPKKQIFMRATYNRKLHASLIKATKAAKC